MINFSVYFKLYKWHIEVFIISKGEKIGRVLKSLDKLGCTDLRTAASNIRYREDSGFTYTNLNMNSSVIVINNSTSIEEFIDTYNHEKNHVEMHICEKYKIDPLSEKASYLSGDLARAFFMALIEGLL